MLRIQPTMESAWFLTAFPGLRTLHEIKKVWKTVKKKKRLNWNYQRPSWNSDILEPIAVNAENGEWLSFTLYLRFKSWFASVSILEREPLVKTAPSASAGRAFFKKD